MWALAGASSKADADSAAKGVTDLARDVPLDKKMLERYNQRHVDAYGWRLSSFELLWGHLLGLIKNEINDGILSALHLTRIRSEVEAGNSPRVLQWQLAPNLVASSSSMAGFTRDVVHNHQAAILLKILMDA